MKQFSLLFLAVLFLGLTSCDKEDEHMHMDEEADYHIHLMSPDDSDKTVGETITVKFEVEDHNGGTVHHVKARVYNKATDEEIMNAPSEAHVHEMDGKFEFEQSLDLDVEAGTTWILEVKAWGHEAGAGEVMDTVEFDVN